MCGFYRVTLSRLAPDFSVRTWKIQQENSHKIEKVTVLTLMLISRRLPAEAIPTAAQPAQWDPPIPTQPSVCSRATPRRLVPTSAAGGAGVGGGWLSLYLSRMYTVWHAPPTAAELPGARTAAAAHGPRGPWQRQKAVSALAMHGTAVGGGREAVSLGSAGYARRDSCAKG
eukprot:SAG31_NODE_2638_length_5328_cov_2.459552_1_plen_171_part_00